MLTLLQLPSEASVSQWVSFCLDFQTEAGFIAVFEQKWQELGGQQIRMNAAYESTEQLYQNLFSRGRRFKSREAFYRIRWRFYANQDKTNRRI